MKLEDLSVPAPKKVVPIAELAKIPTHTKSKGVFKIYKPSKTPSRKTLP